MSEHWKGEVKTASIGYYVTVCLYVDCSFCSYLSVKYYMQRVNLQHLGVTS